MKSFVTISITVLFFFLIGCSVNIKPVKFDTYPNMIPEFKGISAIKIIIPEDAEKKYLIENVGSMKNIYKYYVNLNDLNKIAKELIEEELVEQKVPLSPEANKYLKFSATNVKWSYWAGGWAMGCYFEFDIETSDGYIKHYKSQDGSPMVISRAVGGAVSRAVEKIFRDKNILAYIEK